MRVYEKYVMRKIYPHSSLIIFIEILFLSLALIFLSGFLWFVIDGPISEYWYNYILAVPSLFVSTAFFIIFLSLVIKKIIITDVSIEVADDMGDKRGAFLRRIQHKTSVYYTEITDITLGATQNDSNNNPVKEATVLIPYIVFACKDGQKKMISVYYYTTKQVINIIDEVKKRAALLGNELNIGTGEEIFLKVKLLSQDSDNKAG